jgi:Na+/H+ antiporter NhaD/arsenite permease-like protein
LLVADYGLAPEMERNTIILIIFAVTYLAIAMGRIPGLKLNRAGIALLGAIAMMLFGRVTTAQAVSYVNWPTICLLFGFFVISAQLRLSGFYDVVAVRLANQLSHPARFLLILMLVAGGLSAFLNNDVVCLVFAPITATALLRKSINPVPFLIALAIASNLGAAATVIGNPQNMMISQVAHLDFGGYLLWSIVPVLFAMAAAYGIIWLMSCKHLHSAATAEGTPPGQAYPYNRIHTVKGMLILAVVIGLFFTNLPKEIIALGAAAIHLASPKFRTEELLGLVDWPILVLFMGLFVVAGAFQSTGYGLQAVHWLAHDGYNLNAPVTLVLTTAALSNLIGNSAAVMLLLQITDITQHSVPYFLALSNSFGGNLIIIGAVSNIIVAQQAREMNIKIGFWDFARLGIPVTIAALAALLVRVLLS